jgi:transcriptional regulator with XRE-family HTH domain
MRLLVAEEASDIVKLIRQEIKGCGKTQKQVADHLGFTQKHMSQMMNGKNGISIPVLFRICGYLGASVAIVPALYNEKETP